MNKIQDLSYKIGDVNGKIGYFALGIFNGVLQKVKNLGSSYPCEDGEGGRRYYPKENLQTEIGFCSNLQELPSKKHVKKTLDIIENVNGKWLRIDFPYEKCKGDFGKTDEIVDEAHRRGIKVLPIIYTRDLGLPVDMKSYLEYVEDVVNRYTGKVKVYNIWNEPNSFGFWLDSPKAFAHLLKRTRKKMTETDRDALSLVNLSWLPWRRPWVHESIEMLNKEGALKHIDVIGFDAYPGSYEPGNAFSWKNKIRGTRECLESLGHEDIDIWVTEYGSYAFEDTRLSSHTPKAQTRFLRDATKVISSEDVPVAICYRLRDMNHLPRIFSKILPQEQNFGILKKDYTPKDTEVFDVIRSLT